MNDRDSPIGKTLPTSQYRSASPPTGIVKPPTIKYLTALVEREPESAPLLNPDSTFPEWTCGRPVRSTRTFPSCYYRLQTRRRYGTLRLRSFASIICGEAPG